MEPHWIFAPIKTEKVRGQCVWCCTASSTTADSGSPVSPGQPTNSSSKRSNSRNGRHFEAFCGVGFKNPCWSGEGSSAQPGPGLVKLGATSYPHAFLHGLECVQWVLLTEGVSGSQTGSTVDRWGRQSQVQKLTGRKRSWVVISIQIHAWWESKGFWDPHRTWL